MKLADMVVKAGFAPTGKEATRLIKQGAVRLATIESDGIVNEHYPITDPCWHYEYDDGFAERELLMCGKRRHGAALAWNIYHPDVPLMRGEWLTTEERRPLPCGKKAEVIQREVYIR